MSDLEKRMNELCERHSRIPEGPYFVGIDEATDCPPHTNSGLSLVDTGRQSDWPIARLCEGPTAAAIADIPIMLATLREAAAELVRLRGENERFRNAIQWALGYDVGGPQFEPPEGNHPRYWWRKELRRRACDVDAAMTKEAGNG